MDTRRKFLQSSAIGLLSGTLTFGFSPAGFEDFFRHIGTPKGTPFKAKSPAEAQRIADMHGMVFKQQ